MPHKQDDTTQQLSLLWFSRKEIIKNKNIKKTLYHVGRNFFYISEDPVRSLLKYERS